MAQSVLRLPCVKKRTGLGRSSIYAGVRQGTFPSPIRLGPRAVGWLESDITEWINSRVLARSTAAKAVTATEAL